MKQTLAHQQAQAKTAQRQQAVVLMCRIYVGSINFEVSLESLTNQKSAILKLTNQKLNQEESKVSNLSSH